ncbi:hypothetical protein [Acetobacter cerevisiae]|nr:hypothetical protein [Acetobacter cerevisiae]
MPFLIFLVDKEGPYPHYSKYGIEFNIMDNKNQNSILPQTILVEA